MTAGSAGPRDRTRGLGDAEIPAGGRIWRSLSGNGALFGGYLILGAHVVTLVVEGVWSVIGDLDYNDPVVDTLTTLALGSTVLAPLIGGSMLFIGELQRRGTVHRNARQRTDTVLPQGSNRSLWRLVAPRWNALWCVACAVASVALVVAAATPELGHVRPFGAFNWMVWSLNGAFLAGLAGQNAGTWLKKTTWARRPEAAAYAASAVHEVRPGHSSRVNIPTADQAEARAAAGAPPGEHTVVAARRRAQEQAGATGDARRTAFWRSVGFRWRFDVWLCALGAVGLWLVGFFLGGRVEFPDDAASLELAAWISGVAGITMLAAGLWATTQFWRAGEDLAAGESLA